MKIEQRMKDSTKAVAKAAIKSDDNKGEEARTRPKKKNGFRWESQASSKGSKTSVRLFDLFAYQYLWPCGLSLLSSEHFVPYDTVPFGIWAML